MKGMLAKELLCLKSQGKNLFLGCFFGMVLLLLALLVAPSESLPAAEDLCFMLSTFTSALAIGLTLNSIAMDGRAKWDSFARSLPVRPAAAVGAKYLFSASILALGAAVGLLVQLFVPPKSAAPGLPAVFCVSANAAALLLCSVVLPVYYKAGSKGATFAFTLLFLPMPVTLSFLFNHPTAQVLFLLKLLPPFSIAAALVSYFISCHIYAHKEF